MIPDALARHLARTASPAARGRARQQVAKVATGAKAPPAPTVRAFRGLDRRVERATSSFLARQRKDVALVIREAADLQAPLARGHYRSKRVQGAIARVLALYDRASGELLARIGSAAETPALREELKEVLAYRGGKPLSTDRRLVGRVQRWLARLLPGRTGSGTRYAAVVENQAGFNAKAHVGGLVIVRREVAKAPKAELAAAIAHEAAHLQRQDSARFKVTKAVRQAVEEQTPSRWRQDVAKLFDLADAAESRRVEWKADEVAVQLLIQAGAKPLWLARLFERMARHEGPRTEARALSSHPELAERAAAVRRRVRC